MHISIDSVRNLQQELIFRLERSKENWFLFCRPIWVLRLRGHNQSEHNQMQSEAFWGWIRAWKRVGQAMLLMSRKKNLKYCFSLMRLLRKSCTIIINLHLRKNNEKNWRKIRNMLLSLEKKTALKQKTQVYQKEIWVWSKNIFSENKNLMLGIFLI